MNSYFKVICMETGPWDISLKKGKIYTVINIDNINGSYNLLEVPNFIWISSAYFRKLPNSETCRLLYEE